MARKLPETIVLGGVRLTRYRDTHGKLTNTWVDENNYNSLFRTKKGFWLFEGSPLTFHWSTNVPCKTPEAAYREALEYQLVMLRKQYEGNVKTIKEALSNAQ